MTTIMNHYSMDWGRHNREQENPSTAAKGDWRAESVHETGRLKKGQLGDFLGIDVGYPG